MDANTYYQKQAKKIIKDVRENLDVSYKDLSLRLEAYGVHIEPQVLINRINKGKFSFTFALQVLAALGYQYISIPEYPPTKRDQHHLDD